MATYQIGCEVRLYASFTSADGLPADPTAITVKVKSPTGQTNYTTGIVRDGLGCYHFDLPLTAAGQWHYRWIGTGAVVAADEKFFTVQGSVFK